MDVHVAALEGSGGYHLVVEIVGTIQRLARQAIIGAAVYLQLECHLFDDCTYRYGGLEMRGSGSGFTLELMATTGGCMSQHADV